MDVGDKVAIANYGTMAAMMFIGVVAAIRAYREPGLSREAKRLIIGIGLFCACFAVHQSYWFTRWYLLANGDPLTRWFLDNSWMLTIPYSMGFAGSIYVAHALFRRKCFMAKSAEGFMHGWFLWVAMVVAFWCIAFASLPG